MHLRSIQGKSDQVTRLQTKRIARLKRAVKKQDQACELLIDARDSSSEWDERIRTTHRIALDLALQALDLLHKQVNRELGFVE
jgi:hypothetical protein